MKKLWDQRYSAKEYVYGRAPNTFFAQQLIRLDSGSILLPAEGEGRNAVYAAIKGWDVTAFDFSESGKVKAMQLAEQYQVEVEYQISDASSFSTDRQYDAIGLIYAHFEGEDRARLFQTVEEVLRPGGVLIMEVFSKNQLGRSSGGPKSEELLYSRSEIMQLLPNLTFTILEEVKTELNEGSLHQGEAAVIRALASK